MASYIFYGLEKIHPRFQPSLKSALDCLANWLGEALLGACVVGSSVCGDWDEGSDLDLIFVTREALKYSVIAELEETLQEKEDVRVQLINMYPDFLREEHLQTRSTMAHSIRRGLILLDKEGLFDDFNRLTDVDLPEQRWIKKHFLRFISVHFFGLHGIEQEKEMQKVLNYCQYEVEYPNDVCRAIVNFSILYLELHGIIPTSKRQIIRGLERMSIPPTIINDVHDSMYIRREDRRITEEEVARFIVTGEDLKCRVQEILGISDAELEEYDIRMILKHRNR